MYGILWGQKNGRKHVKVQYFNKFKEIDQIQDPVKFELALRQVADNLQYKTYFPLSEWTITQKLHSTKQDKGMSLLPYHDRFKSIADTENYVDIKLVIWKGMKEFSTQSSATDTKAETYHRISFLMGGDRDYYCNML